MPRLYFSGVVLPERAPLSISAVHAKVIGPDGTARAQIALNIWANQISATVDSEETDVLGLRNLVRSEVEFVTSLAGFLLGFGYDVEITKASSVCLILIGFSRLAKGKREQDTEGSASTNGSASSLDQEAPPARTRTLLSSAFVLLGHITVALTVLGFAYMLFFAPQGSASGVGVGVGLLLAGALYGLAAMAKR